MRRSARLQAVKKPSSQSTNSNDTIEIECQESVSKSKPKQHKLIIKKPPLGCTNEFNEMLLGERPKKRFQHLIETIKLACERNENEEALEDDQPVLQRRKKPLIKKEDERKALERIINLDFSETFQMTQEELEAEKLFEKRSSYQVESKTVKKSRHSDHSKPQNGKIVNKRPAPVIKLKSTVKVDMKSRKKTLPSDEHRNEKRKEIIDNKRAVNIIKRENKPTLVVDSNSSKESIHSDDETQMEDVAIIKQAVIKVVKVNKFKDNSKREKKLRMMRLNEIFQMKRE